MTRDDIIARLRAEKAADEAAEREEELKRREERAVADRKAEEVGRKWATETASYSELKRAAELVEKDRGASTGWIVSYSTIQCDFVRTRKIEIPVTGLNSFFKGAGAVWDEIKEAVKSE